MNQTITSSKPTLRRHPRRGIWILQLITAAGAVAWATTAFPATVIDDFNAGPQWDMMIDDTRGFLVELADGQAHITQPAGNPGRIVYYRAFPMPEGRQAEYRLDVVGGLEATGLVYLAVSTHWWPEGGYLLAYDGQRLSIHKYWEGGSTRLATTPAPWNGEPMTLTLGLGREGDTAVIEARVVLRDDPGTILGSAQANDGPQIDGTNDNGTAFLAPSQWVVIQTWQPSGQAHLVIDNLVCSESELPGWTGIARGSDSTMELSWDGARIPLEADEASGPWHPCNELVLMPDGDPRRVVLNPLGPHRYFCVARGFQATECCETWNPVLRAQIRPRTPSTPAPRLVRRSDQRAQITGTDESNADFLLAIARTFATRAQVFWSGRASLGSLDLVDWDPTMLDAGIGILLRVAGERGIYYLGDSLPEMHYSGLLTLKRSEDTTQSELSIVTPAGGESKAQRFPALDPAKDYRLQFTAVENRLTLQVFDLEHPDVPLAVCEVTDDRIPEGLVLFHGTRSSTDTYNVTIRRLVTTTVFTDD